MESKDTSFANTFMNSIRNFEKYPEMATKSFGNVLKYFIKLMLLFTLFASMFSVYGTSKTINKGLEYFKTEMPDLSFSDNELKIESDQKIEIKPDEAVELIIIDTNTEDRAQIDEYIDKILSKDSGIVFLKDRLIVNAGAGTIEYSYEKLAKSYNIGNMTKESIIDYFTGSTLVTIYCGLFIITYISLFVAYSVSAILDVIALSILGYITALVLRMRLRFVAMVKIAIYSITLPMVLNLLYVIEQTLLGYDVKYFSVMYITIAYIYIITAILMIKSDLIKRGEELTKIFEEEKKVREQLEREKQKEKDTDKEEEKEETKKEKEENDNKNNDNKDENTKNKKQKKTDKDDGVEDEGLEGGKA